MESEVTILPRLSYADVTIWEGECNGETFFVIFKISLVSEEVIDQKNESRALIPFIFSSA